MDAGPLERAARCFHASQSGARPWCPTVTLRRGRRADLAALEALERRAFTHDRIAPRSFARFFTGSTAVLIVADCDGLLCGYALALLRARSRIARLYSIAVDAAHAGQGIGARLLAAAEGAASRAGCKAMRLEVRDNNAPARRLYLKFGYRVVGHRAAYYEDGSDALRLEKPLAR
jgi:ribosomal protein S18 acetylase RimI-like enzyme